MPTPHPHPEIDCEVLADAMGPDPAATGSQPPAPPTRAARWLEAGNGLLTRGDTLLERWLPRELNPLAHLGAAANAMLVLATFTGVLLLVWYSPSLQFAWTSLADLGPRSLGGIMRSMHRYASDLLMLLVLTHALRVFLARKFSGARWLAWASGIAMLGLIWFIGWTGYWLVWDERAQLLALDSVRAIDVLPVFGEPMLRLFASERTVPSLLFFVVFFLHMLLPLGIAAGLCLHLARLSRSALLPDWRLSLWLTGAVLIAALVYPATNAAPAQMAVKPDTFSMDWWYLGPLAITSRLGGGGIWLTFLLAMAGLMTVPWWLGRRRQRATFQAAVNISRCFSCSHCAQDCPFGAITMVARTDGKPFPSQAQIDAERCIGCGICTGSCDTQAIGMAWFDAQQVTRELETWVQATAAAGKTPALALVCANTEGGWDLFDRVGWSRRLPGYEVRPIPCVGWVEPKLIERLIGKGAVAVLIVGCGTSEAFAKEGNRWLPARLDGTREPSFRPNRADPRKVAHVTFDPLRPELLTTAAQRLRDGRPAADAPPRRRAGGWLVGLVLTAVVLAVVLVVSDAPFRNPAPAEAEFVFSFQAHGDWLETATAAPVDPAEDKRPVHMRAALPAQRGRAPVVVRLEVEGRTIEQTFQPKGLKSDGASVGEMRVPLNPGIHAVMVTLITNQDPAAEPKVWRGTIEAEERHLNVLSFESARGFELEP